MRRLSAFLHRPVRRKYFTDAETQAVQEVDMRRRTLFISLFLLLAAWAAAFLTVFFQECELPQDAVAVNEVLQTVQDGWRLI